MKKKFLLTIVFISLVFIGLAQVPNAFNYQAAVRDGSGEVLANQSVSFRISILQGSETGTVVYEETHAVTTNGFGLANLRIGGGTVVSGVFGPAGWTFASHFLKVEFDPAGGSAFTHLGTSEFVSVPYAFSAMYAEMDQVDDSDADPANELQTISLAGSDLTLSDGGGTVTLPSSGGGDDWGTQTVESDGTLTGNGTSGDPLSVNGDLTDDQTLSLAGNDLSISDGNTVSLPGSVWSVGGTDVYYNGGNVGIGTSDPMRPLDLHGGATSIYMGFHNDASGNEAQSGLLVGLGSSNTGMVWNYENGPIQFATNNARRLEIANNGYVGIGMVDPPSLLSLYGSANTSYQRFFHSTSGTTTTDGLLVGIASSSAYVWNYENTPLAFATNNIRRIHIMANGNVGIATNAPTHLLSVNGTAGKTGGGMWSVFSDRRLKDMHGEYDKGLSEIIALRPVKFNYKADNPLGLDNECEEIGLIAQEVQEIFPEAVSVSQSGYLDFNMHPINVAFVNAIKELNSSNAALKAANDDLQEQVNKLESRLAEIEKTLQQ